MGTVCIVEQYQPTCQGNHVEVEYTLIDGRWERSDAFHSTPVVERIVREQDESDADLYARADQRANQIDRDLHCSRCYR